MNFGGAIRLNQWGRGSQAMEKSNPETSAKYQLIRKADIADAYADFGYYLHQQADYTRAIKAYKLGLNINPEHDLLHCKLGLTLHNQGNHSSAIFHYEKAVLCNPENSEALYYLGFIFLQENRTNEAVSCLEDCLRLNPNLGTAYHYLALGLQQLGKHEQALSLLQKRLISSFPAHEPDVLFTLGDLLSERGTDKGIISHEQACLDAFLEAAQKQHLHCFGDSHRSVFNNLKNITCHNVGAGTAYNLINNGSTTGAGSKILRRIESLNPKIDGIILTFGEIDCMEHIYKNCFRSLRSPATIISELTNRFISFADILADKGFLVLIYGPAFSGLAMNSFGRLQDRNLLVKSLNEELKNACKSRNNIIFASLTQVMIDMDALPRLSLSRDGRHLDYFPKGSAVFQAVIFSKFMDSLQSKASNAGTSTTIKLDQYCFCIDKPYIVINHGEAGRSAGCASTNLKTGILKINRRPNLIAAAGKISFLWVDLLDHLPIQQLTLEISADRERSAINCLLEVIGGDKNGSTVVATININTLGKFSRQIRFKPSIVRVVGLKIHWSPEMDSNPKKINVSKLQITGPYFSIKQHAGLD